MHLASTSLGNVHSCKSRTPNKIVQIPNKLLQTPNKLLHLAVGHLANYIDSHLYIYVDRHIYLTILGWNTIYDFSSTKENETSVMSIYILWALSKIKRE